MYARSWRSFSICVALAAVLIGCSVGSVPSPSVGGMDDVIANLVLRGVTVHRLVSGDAGCTDSTLHPNALRVDLTLAQDGTDYEVYLFRWRRPADFDASAGPFAACLNDYAAGIVGEADVDSIEVRPWRAFGPAWTEELRRTLEQALHATGGG